MRAICIASGATCYWRPASRPRPFSCCRVHRQGCRRTAGDGAVVAAAAVVVVDVESVVAVAAQGGEVSGPMASERLHVLTACVAIPADDHVSRSLHN